MHRLALQETFGLGGDVGGDEGDERGGVHGAVGQMSVRSRMDGRPAEAEHRPGSGCVSRAHGAAPRC